MQPDSFHLSQRQHNGKYCVAQHRCHHLSEREGIKLSFKIYDFLIAFFKVTFSRSIVENLSLIHHSIISCAAFELLLLLKLIME